MAQVQQPSSSLLRLLEDASIAAEEFGTAFKRAWPLQSPAQTNTQPSWQSVLGERELKNWREASKGLAEALPKNSHNYFVPLDAFNAQSSSCLDQVNAVNLGLILDMFLPSEIKQAYPKWTSRVPLVDSNLGGHRKLSLDEQIDRLMYPLTELRSVYLRLCSGMKEKEINYVIRWLVTDICATCITIVTKARKISKPSNNDLRNVFNTSFIDDTLVPSVFKTNTDMEESKAVWNTLAIDRIKKLQGSAIAKGEYSWDNLSKHILRDVFRHLIPTRFEAAREERTKRSASMITSIASSSKNRNSRPNKTMQKSAATRSEDPQEAPLDPPAYQDVEDDPILDEGGGTEDTTTKSKMPSASNKGTVFPKGFRFNAPQANAVRITMTPSPTSSPAHDETSKNARISKDKSKSMITKMKKAVTAERDRTRTTSTSTIKSTNGSFTGVKIAEADKPVDKKRKRDKELENEHDQETVDSPTKKRKTNSVMPPPAPSVKSAATSLKKPSVVAPFAGRESGDLSITLIDSSELAGTSTSKTVGPTSVQSAKTTAGSVLPRRPKKPVVMAESDSYTNSGTETETESDSVAANIVPQKKPGSKNELNRDTSTTKGQRTTKIPSNYDLDRQDQRHTNSQIRLEQIKAINNESKQRLIALDGEEGNESSTKQQKESKRTEAPPVNLDSDSDETDDSLKRSKLKLASIKKKVEGARPPKMTRAHHLHPTSDEEQDAEAGNRKRGRPRKPVAEERIPKSTPKENRYKTGGNELGRVRWTAEEDKALLFALDALFGEGKLTRPWNDILQMHGPQGELGQELAGRNAVQLKDRARNLAIQYARQGKVPEYLSWITLPGKKPA
ncbi:hypothetical protein CPB86DRAFT_352323 [Serendipita vermifera]|nr:hypothetical protein CPB86DRAFT_352323 [Serendipita vermifera]